MKFGKMKLSSLLKILMIFALTVTSFTMVGAKSTEAAGFGQWVNVDKNWRYRVDEPLSDGGKENEYHVHVEGKVGSKKVDGAETVKGNVSHKKTLKGAGVPTWVQKEVKASPEFKKGVAKQKELDAAKDKAKKMSWSDIVVKPTIIFTIAAIIGVQFAKLTLTGWKSFIYS